MDDDVLPSRKDPLGNTDLGSIVGELLSQFGWYLLLLCIVVYLLVQQLSRRRSSQEDPGSHRDAVLVARNQEAMEASRRRMQEELDAKAVVFREKQKEKEEERRKEKLDRLQHGKSIRAAARQSEAEDEASTSTVVRKPKPDRKPLRSGDYNPLTGQGGGSCSWRPGRRGPSSGG
ncbi:selenoprotein S [Takifugu flavidus]|uniref:selenoprotein S n=1 Tax=Takifugu flavidus TaxID=433684 RepID=UPI00254438DD|nr:selenoprotein S [Takifugu flavidus]